MDADRDSAYAPAARDHVSVSAYGIGLHPLGRTTYVILYGLDDEPAPIEVIRSN